MRPVSYELWAEGRTPARLTIEHVVSVSRTLYTACSLAL